MKKVGRPHTYNTISDATQVAKALTEGVPSRKIKSLLGFTDHQLLAARKLLAENPDLMQETPFLVEIEPKSTEKTPKTPKAEKAEKPKPVRLTKIPVTHANLEPGKVHRFIITAAQDDTPKFEAFWTSLQTYARVMNASFITCGLTYQKGLFEDHAIDTATYDKDVSQYLQVERIQLTDDVLIICDANVLPTTANPLAGWQTANRGGHVIIPSTRVALESIGRMQGEEPKFAISTGCCTLPSYTPRAAGRKAMFHHTYGALLIEIDADGTMFPHHLLPDETGAFQHFDRFVDGETITVGNQIEALVVEPHVEQLDPAIAFATWGICTQTNEIVTDDCLAGYLRPKRQIVHDTLDFRRRNHHDIHDPHNMARIHATTNSNVESEVQEAAAFVNAITRDGCRTTIVQSNHDSALTKWLKNPDGMFDPENAYYWHRLNSVWHDAIRRREAGFNTVHEAFRLAGLDDHIDFVAAGESFLILDIEHGLHGDIGMNGSRGSPAQYRRFGRRTSTGHTHSPFIIDGAYGAGVAAMLLQAYNPGPTRWAHAYIMLYPNGKRGIVFMAADGRFQATGDVVSIQMAA